MAFKFNGTSPETIRFIDKGVTTLLDKLVFNGVTVWKSMIELVKNSLALKTGAVFKTTPEAQLPTNVTVTVNNNVVSFGSGGSVTAGVFWTADLTNRDTFVVNADFNIGAGAFAYPQIRDKNLNLVKSYTEVGSDSSSVSQTIERYYEFDNLNGEHYVGFYFWGGNGQQGGAITVKDLVVK